MFPRQETAPQTCVQSPRQARRKLWHPFRSPSTTTSAPCTSRLREPNPPARQPAADGPQGDRLGNRPSPLPHPWGTSETVAVFARIALRLTAPTAIIALAVGLPASAVPSPVEHARHFDAGADEPMNGAPSTARILLVGDIMLGRGVASIVRSDPDGVFAAIREILAGADIAGANLESPLTRRPHIAPNPNALEADPSIATVLEGFDIVSIANNHAGDAGRASITDTIEVVTAMGIAVTGGGLDAGEAHRPVVIEANGIRVGFLGYDLTRAGTPAGEGAAGIAHWSDDAVLADLAAAHSVADIVIVSVHGGVEYSSAPDPTLIHAADVLMAGGASVMWGHHTHVQQPVIAMGTSVIATGLGNALFDQPGAATTTGGIVEVLVDTNGVRGFRSGSIVHPDRRVRLAGWDEPDGQAAWFDGSWWTWLGPVEVPPEAENPPPALQLLGTVVAMSSDGDQWLMAQRTPLLPHDHPLDQEWTRYLPTTDRLAVYTRGERPPTSTTDPVEDTITSVQICDTNLAALTDRGATVWARNADDRAPSQLATLENARRVGCADLDGDGRGEAIVSR